MNDQQRPTVDEFKLSAARLSLRDHCPEHVRRLLGELDDVDQVIAHFALIGEWIPAARLEDILRTLAGDIGLSAEELFGRLESVFESVVRIAAEIEVE